MHKGHVLLSLFILSATGQNQRRDLRVLLLHILVGCFIHHMDLHHGVRHQQVCLQPVRAVNVDSQHQAVIKHGTCGEIDLCLAILGQYCQMSREISVGHSIMSQREEL